MNEKELNRIIGENIIRLLERNGKTQLDLALALGVSPATVSYWCAGQKSPRMNKIDLICKFFKCNRSDILEEKIENGLTDYYPITRTEKDLILAYRVADKSTKDIILKILEIK